MLQRKMGPWKIIGLSPNLANFHFQDCYKKSSDTMSSDQNPQYFGGTGIDYPVSWGLQFFSQYKDPYNKTSIPE